MLHSLEAPSLPSLHHRLLQSMPSNPSRFFLRSISSLHPLLLIQPVSSDPPRLIFSNFPLPILTRFLEWLVPYICTTSLCISCGFCFPSSSQTAPSSCCIKRRRILSFGDSPQRLLPRTHISQIPANLGAWNRGCTGSCGCTCESGSAVSDGFFFAKILESAKVSGCSLVHMS